MLDTEDLDLSHLTIDDFLPGLEDDLSEDGFGAAKRKKSRKKARRKPARRKAKKATRRKTRRKPRRKVARKAKKATRRKPRRKARRVAGMGAAVATMANALAGNLGKAKRKKSRRKKAKKAVARKPRRKARRKAKKTAIAKRPRRKVARRKARRKVAGLGSLSNAIGRLSYSEVKKSAPVVGGFQWMFSKSGLESVAGGAGGGLVLGLVDGVLMEKMDSEKKLDPRIRKGLSTVATSILMWELGKLMKSGMAAKIGFMYPIIKYIDDEFVQPTIVGGIKKGMGMEGFGFGQMRVPEQAAFSGLGQVRLPESTELVGLDQVRLPEESEEGFDDVMYEEELQGVGQNYEADEMSEENVF